MQHSSYAVRTLFSLTALLLFSALVAGAPNSIAATTNSRDASGGLLFLHHRSYDPETGRFISADPTIPSSDNAGMNRYAYGFNSPAMETDVSGLGGGSLLERFIKMFAKGLRPTDFEGMRLATAEALAREPKGAGRRLLPAERFFLSNFLTACEICLAAREGTKEVNNRLFPETIFSENDLDLILENPALVYNPGNLESASVLFRAAKLRNQLKAEVNSIQWVMKAVDIGNNDALGNINGVFAREIWPAILRAGKPWLRGGPWFPKNVTGGRGPASLNMFIPIAVGIGLYAANSQSKAPAQTQARTGSAGAPVQKAGLSDQLPNYSSTVQPIPQQPQQNQVQIVDPDQDSYDCNNGRRLYGNAC